MAGSKSREIDEQSRFRLLLVDDVEDNLILLSETLDDPAYELVLAASGEQALAAAREARPDIVLLDLRMPGINGHETCRRLKADPEMRDVPILFLSATDAVEDRLEGFAAGAVDFISKPFYPDEVLARVDTHLKIARLTRELSARNRELEREIGAAHAFRADLLSSMLAPLQGESPAVEQLRAEIERIGARAGTVVLHGAMQDGAEAVARSIHECSARRWRPFVKAHLSVPDGGAVFGATLPTQPFRASLRERAQHALGGTIYVEGIDGMSDNERKQLLELHARGEVRIIVHCTEITSLGGLFEYADRIPLPHLSQRSADIPAIVDWILRTVAPRLSKPIPEVSSAELERLSNYTWTGGVAEIESVLWRALMLSEPGKLVITPEHAHVGRSLGRYRLQRQLGKGGMGEVWQAQHELLPQPVAIKIIARGLAGAALERAKQRFSAEAVAIARLQSPYTVRIFDFGAGDGGELYYAMELLTGLDLHLMVRLCGPLSPARTVHLLRQVASSLAEAHEHNLVHRDIKPPNLIVSQLGAEPDWLKVVDFGIVMVEGVSEDDRGVGTPGFVAPEVITGSGGSTTASDIYAVGCCAYWCLTGLELFAGDDTRSLMDAHARQDPVPPSAHVDIPAELDELVLACLSKHPEQRPSAPELVKELERLSRELLWSREDARRWWSVLRGEDITPEPADDSEPDAMTMPRRGTVVRVRGAQ